ncbi:CDP-alcohol phosphatidyltransferase family protein [Streptomyces sp. XM4193]|uniref:DUF5941 domain-containing protein n=1 Tax=Streptomyces sp. XM4193 TaxID=2929782 RepID=UPI001FFBD6E9|nr:DUF5941 domain-containing protein [Streptomyces sp. XM4193]MCK1797316.1 CDP-alcohol phosphatidyltransferase family protein [Streptomyces sp. XM4193]
MSTAILTGPPVAGSSLADDLRLLGFTVHVANAPAEVPALVADTPLADRVALVDARFIGHRHSLRLALTDPRFPAAAAPGLLTVTTKARGALTTALRSVDTAVSDDPTGELAAALEREQLTVHRPEFGTLVATAPADSQERLDALHAVDAVDDEAVRLRSSVKSRDGFFTTHCISPYSRYVARWCARRGLTPNQVTTASLLTALVAAGCAATGTRPGFVAAGLLLLASFVLDCADGQLARYSLQYSTLGAWLDATFDRAKEYAYLAGLALGAARGGEDVWGLALGAMVLQTVRHVIDFAFNEANHDATANTSPTASLSDRLDGVGWTVWARRMVILPIGERWALIAVLTALTTPRVTLTVLLVAGALAGCYTLAGRVLRSVNRRAVRTDRAARALWELSGEGPLAEAAGSFRFRPAPAPVLAGAGTVALLATALFAPLGGWQLPLVALVYAVLAGLAAARPLKGALDWLLPPLFRTAEYLTVLLLAHRFAHADDPVNGALPAAFGLVSALAYHHYDTVYRIRGGTGAPPRGLVRATGGHEGRTVLIAVVAAATFGTDWLDGQGFPLVISALAVALALIVLVESIRFWMSSTAPAVHDETGEPA